MKKTMLGIAAVLLVVALFVGCKPGGNTNPPATGGVAKIGAILPQTGPGAVFADYIQKGLELAVEQVNSASPTTKLELVYGDSKNQPADGIAVYNKMRTVDNLDVMVVALSSVTKALAPLATSNKTLLIGTAVALPGVTDVSDYVFRLYPEAHGLAGVMAPYAAKTLKLRRAAVVYLDDDFGRSSFDVFKQLFEQDGGKVVFSESYKLTEKDYRTQLSKLQATNPDCIWLTGYGPAYGTIIKQIAETGVKAQILGDMTLALPVTLKAAGSAAEGAYIVDGVMADDFVTKFKAKYAEEPTSYAGYAYDIIELLGQAAQKGPFNADTVRQDLLTVKDYPGAMGKITFTANRDCTLQFVVKKVKNGVPGPVGQ